MGGIWLAHLMGAHWAGGRGQQEGGATGAWPAGPVPDQGVGDWSGAGLTRWGWQLGLEQAGWLAAVMLIIATDCSSYSVIPQFWLLGFYICRLGDSYIKHILREMLSIWFWEHWCDHTSYNWCVPSCWAGSIFFPTFLFFFSLWDGSLGKLI